MYIYMFLSQLYCIPRTLSSIYSFRFALSFPFHYCRAFLYTCICIFVSYDM